MSRPVVTLNDAIVIEQPLHEVFDLFTDPAALMHALNVKGATARKLGNAERWVMGYPDKLGDKVIDLSVSDVSAPKHVVWQAALRGFEVETRIRFAPETETATRLRLVSIVRAASLRAKLMAPILKLGKGRLKRGLRKSLNQMAKKLKAA